MVTDNNECTLSKDCIKSITKQLWSSHYKLNKTITEGFTKLSNELKSVNKLNDIDNNISADNTFSYEVNAYDSMSI
ncbi:hypothetical protein [Wolbachia endosymbiont (group B) of Episyrphus balteatus]|uniref:hypothetical protein n=1 Tax=Wolbachia endosymbiont (group B) of Episyrphus balteatus TaxID=2954009 RepID=UPI002227FE9A|nr:hypothetical protein [Wolbachia endosymbiont (group B) of Episyrphus balteatus]